MKKKLVVTITSLLIFCQPVMAENLFKAIEVNDLPQTKNILRKDPQLINTVNEFEYTPLIAAVKDGRKEIIDYLLDAGADINTGKGYSALGMAVGQNDYNTVQMLINRGADVNILGGNPLNLAAEKGDLDVVKLLIAKGADVNFPRDYDLYPLHHAAVSGHLDVVQYLIEKGADIHRKTDYNQYRYNLNAIDFAVLKGKKNVAQFLLSQGAEVDLIVMVGLGKKELLKDYFIKNRDLDFRQFPLNYLLHLAVRYGEQEIAEMLIENGANIHAANDIGDTPLHFAVGYNQLNLAKWLLSKGADPNKQRSPSLYVGRLCTPLDIAVEKNNSEMIDILKNFGGKISETSQGECSVYYKYSR
jgi:ankyrin repeat protein